MEQLKFESPSAIHDQPQTLNQNSKNTFKLFASWMYSGLGTIEKQIPGLIKAALGQADANLPPQHHMAPTSWFVPCEKIGNCTCLSISHRFAAHPAESTWRSCKRPIHGQVCHSWISRILAFYWVITCNRPRRISERASNQSTKGKHDSQPRKHIWETINVPKTNHAVQDK